MMTAASIGAGDAQGYSEYLESRTITPSRGDYYLSEEGLPAEAQGVWHLQDSTRQMLGIKDGEPVRAQQLVRLMEGRHPATGEWLRQAGADGRRAGGIDLTFSAPKSVSAVWAIGSPQQRAVVEAAHGRAVDRALTHLREEVEVVRRGAGGARLELAGDVIAAEFRHTTARGVSGEEAPDPQLHSHVVVTGVVRQDGRVAAVASRPVFRSARELGAFYRSALADELRAEGFGVVAGTGKHGRYFEVRGVGEAAREALSGRSREVWLAAERFRARYGRAPKRNELRNVKLENRRAKTPETYGELQAAWEQRGQPGLTRQSVEALQTKGLGVLERADDGRDFQERVTDALTQDASTFTRAELRAAVLEHGAGERSPEQVTRDVQALIESGDVIALEGERFTTRQVRASEQAVLGRMRRMAGDHARQISDSDRQLAAQEVSERIGGSLTAEQQQALCVLTGSERTAVLVGQAGAGKGVVIDAAARAERHAGRRVYGVAVAGANAERLGRDSPALQDHTMTLDSFVARAQTGSLLVDEKTTVYFDEAGMSDSRRLDALSRLVDERGATLLTVGDAKQLPSIGPGGLFTQISRVAPTAEVSEVHRTDDPAERQAWADLRAGRAEQAMAHYHARGQLHFADTRDQAAEAAVKQWVEIAERHGVSDVALMSDASTQEIDRLNARAQHLLAQNGHLGEIELALPDRAYGLREHDRVAFVSQHYPDDGGRRVENGTRATVTHLDPERQQATVQVDASGREIVLQGERELAAVRLGYAQHLYRQQGATVQRAVVVTGGWQTSQEGAYVQASRARQGTDWHLAREDLGSEGQDADRISRLSQLMRASRAQTPSIAYKTLSGQAEIGQELAASTQQALDRDQALDRGEGIGL